MKKLFLLLINLLFCGSVFAAGIDEIVFFGDSLSDNGNLYNIVKIIPKTPPYYNGRFANGPIWAEIVGDYYQNKLNITYSDYAYGGATTLSFNASEQFISPISLEGELYAYYASSYFSDKSRTLFVFWIGANDYLNDDIIDSDKDDKGAGEKLTSDVVDQIAWALNSLIDEGAQYFLILNVPDLSVPPLAKITNKTKRLKYLSELHNQKLEKMLKNTQALYPQVRIFTIDTFDFLHDVVAHLDQYNQKYQAHLRITDQFCWQGGVLLSQPLAQYQKGLRDQLQAAFNSAKKNQRIPSLKADTLADAILKSPALQTSYNGENTTHGDDIIPCDDPDQYIFWDPVHPTAVVHRILAQIATNLLDTQAADLLNN